MLRRLVILSGIILVIAVTLLIFISLRLESKHILRIPILMYHEVGETANSAWCVPIETFRSQMSFLREQGFKTILPSDISAHFGWGKSLPRKPVIITFDDGYLSTLTIIEPVLKENGLRAIIYLITGQVAETAADRREYEGKKCLVWPEVLAMQKRGIFVFGGHSHSHSNLAAAGDPLHDISECRKQLKLHGIRKPYSFCYPYGQQNERTQKAVMQARFQTAVVCEDAVASIGPATNLFALPRVSVMGGSHAFKFVSRHFADNEKTLVYRIIHDGIPLEISACLSTGRNENKIWLPAREVSQGEFDLQFTLPGSNSGNEQNLLEIRDKHRLFRMATINQ